MLLQKKYCVNMRVLNLFQDLSVYCLKVFVGVGTKDKPLGELIIRPQLICDQRGCDYVFVVLGGVCFDGISREFAE